jgi:hypothetical protein
MRVKTHTQAHICHRPLPADGPHARVAGPVVGTVTRQADHTDLKMAAIVDRRARASAWLGGPVHVRTAGTARKGPDTGLAIPIRGSMDGTHGPPHLPTR